MIRIIHTVQVREVRVPVEATPQASAVAAIARVAASSARLQRAFRPQARLECSNYLTEAACTRNDVSGGQGDANSRSSAGHSVAGDWSGGGLERAPSNRIA